MTAINTADEAAFQTGGSVQPTPIKVTFNVEEDCLRKVIIKEPGREIKIYHIYPRLGNWPAKTIPDGVNPRSHEEEALTSGVAKAIEATLREEPRDFYLANRGSSILAKEVTYYKEKGLVEIEIEDPDLQGIADGATTDAVIAKVQNDLKTEQGDKFAVDQLNQGRIHLEVIVGLTEKERIDRMVLGRNTSRQVKAWSMSDFRGDFDWIKAILETPGSPFKDKVGYEENEGKPLTILDVLSILTLFHPEWDAKGGARGGKAPTVAYSSKGRMNERFVNPDLAQDYRALEPILNDVLRLHDYVYAKLPAAYKDAKDGKAKLGKRSGFENRAHNLHLTGTKADYVVPAGVLFPLLASLRALLRYEGENEQKKAVWKTDPFQFFDRNGAELVGTLFDQLELVGGNPQTAGKKKPVYTTLHDRARLLMADEK
jgi:hypothetical protein